MRSSFSQKFARQIGAVALTVSFLLAGVPPVFAQEEPVTSNLTTLRDATKSGKIKMKVQGDGQTTTEIGLQLTNTTDSPIKVVIPANEVLHPSVLSVQTMVVTQDVVVLVNPHETALPRIKCFCGSPKTIAPPPAAQEGLNFDVGDYKDPATWNKLAAIIAAGQELSTVGAFGTLFLPGKEALQKNIDEQITKEIDDRVKVYLSQNLTATKEQAQEAVRKDMEAIKIKAEQTVNQRAKQQQLSRFTQLAIWRLLGIQSGKPEDAVTPDKMTSDFFREFAAQVKTNAGLLTTFGGKINKDGTYTPDPRQKQVVEANNAAIFDVVDLTVKRSAEAGLTGIASLPKDDPCDTFCSVGERAFNQGDYTEAQELLNSAVRLAQKFGEADPRLSRSLNSLGLCYIDMSNFPLAQQNLQRALDLRQKVFGAETKEVAEVDNNLGLLRQGQENWKDAGPLFNSAVTIYSKAIGPTCDPVGVSLNNLGKNLCQEGKPEDARDDLQRALLVALNNCPQDVKGTKLPTPFVAEIDTNLADAYCQDGKYETAGPLYEKALAIDAKALGREHPFLARIYDGLANVTSKTGKSAQSDDYKQQSDGLKDLTLGKGNKEIAASPLSSTAFLGRQWNYWQGQKDFQTGVASVRAGVSQAMTAAMNSDASKMNRPIKDKWALVIGISKFKDPTISLQYAAKDAADMADYLTKEAHFAPDHVRLLTNEKATRTEIMSQLGDTWLPRVANPDDLVMVFFSSHGSPTTMDVGSINYLVAYDTDKTKLYGTGIPLQEFADTIKKRINTDRVVLVMDACHSGAAIGAKGLFRDLNLDANQVAQGTGQLVICSSGANESSWESTRYKNGVFTHYLLEGLRKDDNLNKLSNVFDYMKNHVIEEVQFDRHGARQTPALQTKWVGNDLVIGVKPAEPRPGTRDGDPNAQTAVAGTKTLIKAPPPVTPSAKGPAVVHKPAPAGTAAKSSNQVPAKGKPQIR